jgi:hypothetical protein
VNARNVATAKNVVTVRNATSSANSASLISISTVWLSPPVFWK